MATLSRKPQQSQKQEKTESTHVMMKKDGREMRVKNCQKSIDILKSYGWKL